MSQESEMFNQSATEAESKEEVKLGVEILPGEYSYDEAVQAVKGTGKYIISFTGPKENQAPVREAVAEGKLPEGKYWEDNGGEMGHDDGYFEVYKLEEEGKPARLSVQYGSMYAGQKCKVAVWTERPKWWGDTGNTKFWFDEQK